MKIGIVKRFNKIKGYGFIMDDTDSKEIFVHFSEVDKEGYKELKEGQRVSYTLSNGERGDFAVQVKIID
tara:strand:+ start:1231 stop:1437 length:207 start_codon:yes stop_codon:yes gene_type:complete